MRSKPFSFSLKQPRGSAYLELLMVFIILAALFAIIVPTYFDYVDKAKLTLAHNTIDTVGKALKLYHHKHQTYPANIDFTSGKDTTGGAVFTESLLEQIHTDFSSIDSYSSSVSDYTLTATATDKQQTTILLTPKGIQTGKEP
ncbi:MAG: hypothetical protein C0624_03760 [Desulfuromonas sp.]|nr:MAG: hypothetical protein C0624_03760 [Desulfuromonas sp.]